MGQLASKLRRRATDALFALAAVFLAFGPGLDAFAQAAPADSPRATPAQLLRAFDVIDDALDHIKGKPLGAAQQQLQFPHALPGQFEPPRIMNALSVIWGQARALFPPSIQPESLRRPPRI